MRRWMPGLASALLTLAACASAPPPAPGAVRQTPVVGHPDPLSLLDSRDPALAANKKLAFDMWRGVVNAGHVELADDLLVENYIQHSPLLPTGRTAFKKIFSVVPRRDPIPALPEPPLVALIAERDLVVMAFVERLPDPGGSDPYTSTHFNLFRVSNGRLAEHWHSLQGPPGPEVLRPEAGGPQRVTGVTGAGQLALLQASDPQLSRNKRLVFDLRRALDAGHPAAVNRYLTTEFIEHSPGIATGRETRKALHAPVVAVVAQGDLVAHVSMLEHSHPSRPGETFTSTWFDMYRIAEGRVAEHWDAAVRPALPRN